MTDLMATASDGVASTPPIAERRVTSILFADLVGFTPFAERLDPEDVRDALSGYFQHCRDIIHRYGGTVEKFIGDAVMAVWGVPSVHEDDAERAVRAGLDLIHAIGAYGVEIGAHRLQVRVGIATGEVAVTIGAVGEGMVSGDAVNTASRVQAKATPGEVWVDEQTVRLTSAAVRYVDQGEHELKGKSQPARLYRAEAVVREPGTGPLADHLAVPLAGYRRELAHIRDIFHATVDEGRGRLLLVVGEPGVGKTRLAQEFREYLDGLSAAIYWHWGQCLTYGEGIVYAALVHAVRHRLGIAESDPAPVVVARITDGLTEMHVDAAERAWLTPRIAVLLGAGGGTFAREDLFAAWLAWFDVLGRTGQPLVWVVEDAHHADDALLDFMEHLARSAATPVMVLALARPELLDRRHRFGSGRRSSLLNLEGLNDESMAVLIDALVGDLPELEREHLVRRADGIPLYAIETVRAMLDRSDTGTNGPDGRSLASHVLTTTPASLQVLVSSRLDALPPQDRSVLQDAAVLGNVFDRDDLRFLTGLDDNDLDATLARLAHRDLVGPVTDRFSPHVGSLAFVQSVVRQVAYEMLSRRDRIDRHVRIANHQMDQEAAWDRAAIVAQHLTDAISLAPEHDPLRVALADQRSSWLERAAERAGSVGAHGDALRLYQLALEHMEEETARARLQLQVAESASIIGSFEVAIAAARTLETQDPSLAASATAIESRALRDINRNDESIAALDRYPTPDSLASIDPAVASRIAYLWTGRLFDGLAADHAEDWAKWAYRYAVRAGEPALLADALNGLGLTYTMQDDLRPASRHFFDASAQISRDHHLPVQLWRALTNIANLADGVDLDLCLRSYREASAILRQGGIVDWTYVSDINLGHVLWLAGEWDECLRVETETPAPEQEYSQVSYALSHVPAVLIAHARGSLGELPRSWGNLDALKSRRLYVSGAHLQVLGLAQWLRGDQLAGVHLVREAAHTVFENSGIHEDFSYVWQMAMELTVTSGQFDDARNLLDMAVQQPAYAVGPYLRAGIAAWRGTIAALDPHSTTTPAAIEADLRAGIAGYDAFGAIPDRARNEARLGLWLQEQGRPGDAREVLRSAATTYRDLGAARWLAELPDDVRELSGS